MRFAMASISIMLIPTLSVKVCCHFLSECVKLTSVRLKISSLVSWMSILWPTELSVCVFVYMFCCVRPLVIDSCLNCAHRLQVFPKHQCVWSDLWVCFCYTACPAAFPSGQQWKNMSLQAPQSTAVTEINTGQHTHTHSGEHLNFCIDTLRYKDVYRKTRQK